MFTFDRIQNSDNPEDQTAAILHTSVTVLPRSSRNALATTSSSIKTATGTISLFFAGDIMPSRFVATKMRSKGFDYPFGSTIDMIRGADLAFANLESPVTPGPIVKNGEMTFRTDPEFIPALAAAGMDIVSLANNHSPNFGELGLKDTFRFLDAAHILHVGAGTTTAAYAPVIKNVEGIRIAFVAMNDTDVVPPEYCANDTRIGTACIDESRMHEAIVAARTRADVVIFTMHTGAEYVHAPSARQQQYAHAAIDAGADLVVGHHPHVVQSAEIYKGRRIYYSLGNFIFDQNWSRDTRLGLVVIAMVDRKQKRLTGFEHKVVRIDDYARPTPATLEETKEILTRLGI
jgi:poly-gamma-glutamate synthesis protein (capsule biosynthesis protein)